MRYTFLTIICIGSIFIGCQKDVPIDLPNEIIVNTSNLQFNGSASGCRSFCVFKTDSSDLYGLEVIANSDSLNLQLGIEQIIYLPHSFVEVSLNRHDSTASSWYCNDVLINGAQINESWEALSGAVYITLIQDSIEVNPWAVTCKVNIRTENILLADSFGVLPTVVFDSVLVGWLPG